MKKLNSDYHPANCHIPSNDIYETLNLLIMEEIIPNCNVIIVENISFENYHFSYKLNPEEAEFYQSHYIRLSKPFDFINSSVLTDNFEESIFPKEMLGNNEKDIIEIRYK